MDGADREGCRSLCSPKCSCSSAIKRQGRNIPPQGNREPRKSRVCYLRFAASFVLGLQCGVTQACDREPELPGAKVVEMEWEPAGILQVYVIPVLSESCTSSPLSFSANRMDAMVGGSSEQWAK